MNRLKVLISPLSWGFGHAGRMIPLARELQRRGCDVVFAADAPLLRMAEKELPGITLIEIPGLRIRYSRYLPQYICIFLQLPRIVASAVKDHRLLRRLAAQVRPAVIISDNRFGFYHKKIFSVYVTHQVRIAFPGFLRCLEPVAEWAHRKIINRYDLCLVPDYPGEVNLSGRLSHGFRMPERIAYMGPLSRFAEPCYGQAGEAGEESGMSGGGMPEQITRLPEQYACLILSGPEPQRSLLLRKVAGSVHGIPLAVLTATPVTGPVPSGPGLQLIIAPDTAIMHRIICEASLVIARAGYTSVMELASLRRGAVLIPTPGQTEQEYIGRYLDGRYGFVTMKQDRLEKLAALAGKKLNNGSPEDCKKGTPAGIREDTATVIQAPETLPDPLPLLENAIDLLLENKKK